MKSGRSDIVDLTLALHIMTDRAVRVSDTGDDTKAVWLPLSQVEVLKRPGGIVEVSMPERLAREKGLV